MKFQGKTVLITGGSSGIGFEFASQLLERGNKVIVTGRDLEPLASTRQKLSGVHTIQSDVSDPSAIENLYQEVVTKFPELNVLINNAGIMRNLKLTIVRDLDDVTREIDINLSGPVRMVQQFLPYLRGRKGAVIINVSSGVAFIPFPISPVYSATKAAIHSYTQSLRAQLAGTDVTVVELAPPGVETPLFRREFEEEMKGQTGMDVKTLVNLAIRGIEADKTEIRPGASNVLKLFSRVAPGFMFKQMVKMSKL